MAAFSSGNTDVLDDYAVRMNAQDFVAV